MKLRRLTRLALSGLLLAGLAAPRLAAAAQPPSDAAWQAAKEAIWARELAIYNGRAKGDLAIYLASTAHGYKAWPPYAPLPKGNEGLKETGRRMAGKTLEALEMTFLDLALHGDFAVIYYHTHRTRLADGTPVDERFEVTHSWVRERGEWKVLGGMARARPERPDPSETP
ncbi:hypothetical protein [Novosphingobium decolorationis]|uniref:Nuclear transport factor 2 family protein n=1 Tax=Novosphingobium decolorationis TaxID=2698673 RepID=A0ABX8E8V3_9SPHN|nr:hypothetical protein [Novosphingobium decolorationis]QVM84635.1 nuclear transport factor 2 family protein [Novosphingobium decolorationis]